MTDAGTQPALKVNISIGPGWHHEQLIAQLRRFGADLRLVYSWPKLKVLDWDPGSPAPRLVRAFPSYDFLNYLMWAAWRRLPYWNKFEHPKAPSFAGYDFLSSQFLVPGQIFHGWSQVSLRAFRRAKRLNLKTILEHPMLHVDEWQAIAREEYRDLPGRRSGYFSLMPDVMVRRMRMEYEAADRILVPSSACEKSFVKHGIPAGKLLRAPFGVDTESFRMRPEPASRVFRVLYAGRLELLKGVQYLLRAWDSLKLKNSELILAGHRLPEMEPIIQNCISDNIRWVGSVSHSVLAQYYQDCDLVVFPSLCDAFGLVILEAMASGVPVIATGNSGGPDVIREGVDGFLIPSRDSASIADRILWAYGHRESAREMGVMARQKVVEYHSWNGYGDSVMQAYKMLISGTR
jgi:glycosyltransferase involved in cell wall biosynthesis